MNPRPLVCRCCSEEQHPLASINVPPERCSFQGADAKPSLVRRKGLQKEPLINFSMRCRFSTRLGASYST